MTATLSDVEPLSIESCSKKTVSNSATVFGSEPFELRHRISEEDQTRGIHLKQDSFLGKVRKRKNSNIQLCRKCRNLRPIDGDGGFSTEDQWLPFGNHSDLLHRKHCPICSLILNLITCGMPGDPLHPSLVAIAEDVQAVQYYHRTLKSGEAALAIGIWVLQSRRAEDPDSEKYETDLAAAS